MKRLNAILGLSLLACSPSGFVGLEPLPSDVLEGQVLFEGAPVRGAFVHVLRENTSAAAATTNADGRFRFTPLPFTGAAVLVAHDGRGHAAMQALLIRGGGTNAALPMSLEPVARFPELVTFRGIGLDERLTDFSADLLQYEITQDGVLFPAPVVSADDRWTLHLRRRDLPAERGLVEIQPNEARASVVFDVTPSGLRWYDDSIYARQLPSVNSSFVSLALISRATHAELVRLDTNSESPAFRDEHRSVWFEAVAGTSTMSETRALVVSSDARVARGPSLPHSIVSERLVLGASNDALYYLATAPGDVSAGSSPAHLSAHRLDASTLESRAVSEVLNPAGEWIVPITKSLVGGRAYYAQSRADDSCALVELDVDTGARLDRLVFQPGAFGCEPFPVARHGTVLILQGERAEDTSPHFYGLDLEAPASIEDLGESRGFVRSNSTWGGPHALLPHGSADSSRFARLSLETFTFEELDTSAELDGQRVDICATTYCNSTLLPDGTAVFSSIGATSRERDAESIDAITEILVTGEKRIRVYPARGATREESYLAMPVLMLSRVDVDFSRRGADGRHQLFAAPRGREFEAFSQVTFFPVNGAALLGASPDDLWIYYLARDPITGRNQLFRTTTDRTGPRTGP